MGYVRWLIVDNHDSYTYNLVQLCNTLSSLPPIVLLNSTPLQSILQAIHTHQCTHILLSPGPGTPHNPQDIGVCAPIVANPPLPVLGVCLGLQTLACLFGGKIVRAKDPEHGVPVPIQHNAQGLFADLPQKFMAVRYNSLVADPTSLDPSQLEITASDAISGEIMGLRHTSLPIETVQFHPESKCSQFGLEIIQNFLRMHPSNIKEKETGFNTPSEPSKPKGNSRLYCLSKALDCYIDPELLCSAIYSKAGNSKFDSWCFLDSSLVSDSSRYSFICDPTGPLFHSIEYWGNERKVVKRSSSKSIEEEILLENESFFDVFDKLIQSRTTSSTRATLPFDFVGGYCGYFGYEMRHETNLYEDSNVNLGESKNEFPDSLFMFFDRVVAFDNLDKRMWLIALFDSKDAASIDSWFSVKELEIKSLLVYPENGPQKLNSKLATVASIAYRDDRQEYMDKVSQCKDHIRNGDSYELCLTTQVHGTLSYKNKNDSLDPTFDLYCKLRTCNQAPYSCFLRYLASDLEILCSSPERFLRISQDKWVECKPIKGTIRRDLENPESDEINKRTLAASKKDQAENLMIVDLIRNDLTRTCRYDSVHVPTLMDIETFATVHHMVTTVRGQLRDSSSIVQCIKNAFPPGSMTGAPKKRSMDILETLEQNPRGIYSGCIGYISANGSSDFNVVIRTIVLSEEGRTRKYNFSIGCGGAVVILSDPEEEHAEMQLKSSRLLQIIKSEAD